MTIFDVGSFTHLGQVTSGLNLARHERRRGLQLAIEDLESNLLAHDDGHVRLRVRLGLDDFARAVLEVQIVLADAVDVEEEGRADLFDNFLVTDGLDALEHLGSYRNYICVIYSNISFRLTDLGNVLVYERRHS